MSPILQLRDSRRAPLILECKPEKHQILGLNCATRECTAKCPSKTNNNHACIDSTTILQTVPGGHSTRNPHKGTQQTEKPPHPTGQGPASESRDVTHPIGKVKPILSKSKRTFNRPFLFFVKRKIARRGRISGASLISLSAEVETSDILKDRPGKYATKIPVLKEPHQLLADNPQDYITVRGVNPRTGVTSPGPRVVSLRYPHDQNIPVSRRVPIIRKWQQTGDQWISVDVLRKSSTRELPFERNHSTQDLPCLDGFDAQKAGHDAINPYHITDTSQREKVPMQSTDANGYNVTIPHRDNKKMTKILDERLHVTSMTRPGLAGKRGSDRCDHHWGDSAVPRVLQQSNIPYQSLNSIKSCRGIKPIVYTAMDQSWQVTGGISVSPNFPEAKLSRVTEISESDNQSQWPVQSCKINPPLSDNGHGRPISPMPDTADSSTGVGELESVVSGVARPEIKRYNASRGSLLTMRHVTRMKEVPTFKKEHSARFKIRRKPLVEHYINRALYSSSEAGCTNSTVKRTLRKQVSSGHSTRREWRLNCRVTNPGVNTSILKTHTLNSLTANRETKALSEWPLGCPVMCTDGTSEFNKGSESPRPNDMERNSSVRHRSTIVDPHLSTEGASSESAEVENLPMTAFLVATLIFIRDFVLDRKTFRYFMLVFGYLLQMVSHTLYVALLICNAFLICLRTASLRKGHTYLRETKHFNDDLYHAICYALLLTLVFGAVWKVMDYVFELFRLLIWMYRTLRSMSIM